MRSMIASRHLILLGPQAEEFGLFHGPLYYYIFAPFYFLSKGEPWLPLIVMSVINLASAIPLAMISSKITKSKLAGILTFTIFCLSYAMVEYSRWLSNVSITLPFIAWSYYFLYEIFEKERTKITFFLLGFLLGLATQGEIFFVSLIAVFFLVLIVKKSKLINLVSYSIGSVIGMLPILIAQVKFNFLGLKIFSDLFTKGYQSAAASPSVSLAGYINHLGLTFYQTIGALSAPMGLFLLILFLVWVSKEVFNKFSKEHAYLPWLLTILLAHAFLFTFEYVDTVFLDIGLALFLIVMVGMGAYFLYKNNRLLFVGTASLFLIFQFGLFKSYLMERKPFGNYNFIHQSSTLADLDDVISKMYEVSQGKAFTLSVIGTPFGVRTVWASVFELYAREHNVPIPKWFEYYANGYPGEEILAPTSKPAGTHILVLESNIKSLLPEPIIVRELGNQGNHTKEVQEFVIHDTTIQVRKPI